MDSRIVEPIDKIKECIKLKNDFVLQGGAGSGKTETLKQILKYISEEYPNKRIACITHTNLAVNEIISRVGDKHTICTIHSFLNSLIKDFKKNIHQVIFEIFILEKVYRKDISFYIDEKEQKEKEHKNYKKLYERFAKKLYTVEGKVLEKVVGKRLYDKTPETYNIELNKNIEDLNCKINTIIKEKKYSNIEYNKTRYDNLRDLSYGHNSLLKVSSLLFGKYKLLGRILQDKYDYIFIDEYQDTDEAIIDIFLNKIPKTKTVVGLFGDSMQGIYEEGIGDVEKYISNGQLIKIEKKDNYRCSEQVIKFINKHRNDNLEQNVAFKTKNDSFETLSDRQGIVKLFYSIYDAKKPNQFSSNDEKDGYLHILVKLINKVEKNHSGYKKLMLTNKSISVEVGFKILYNIFNARYLDVKEEIEKELTRLQFIELFELYEAYFNQKKNYNLILSKLSRSGFKLTSVRDKIIIKNFFDSINDSDKSAFEVLEIAFKEKFLRRSDSYSEYISRKDKFLNDICCNDRYLKFKNNMKLGYNTFPKMSEIITDLVNEEFDKLKRLYEKDCFYTDLFSDKLKFREIVNYFRYLNEETNYITMHKTKGSGIENVMVVLDEYFWSKYNFKTIFDIKEKDIKKKSLNQKLFYVACSRAINNLICIKLISSEEEDEILSYFEDAEKM